LFRFHLQIWLSEYFQVLDSFFTNNFFRYSLNIIFKKGKLSEWNADYQYTKWPQYRYQNNVQHPPYKRFVVAPKI